MAPECVDRAAQVCMPPSLLPNARGCSRSSPGPSIPAERAGWARRLRVSATAALVGAALVATMPASPARAQDAPHPAFTVAQWERLSTAAHAGDAAAAALRHGYLAGLRDGLRFYTRIGRTFRICWPEDHEIDLRLLETVVGAVQREHPDLAKPSDNFAEVAILSLLDAYSCR